MYSNMCETFVSLPEWRTLLQPVDVAVFAVASAPEVAIEAAAAPVGEDAAAGAGVVAARKTRRNGCRSLSWAA